MNDRPVYMDNHSTTMVDPLVLNAMLPYFQDRFGNASSVSHVLGAEAGNAVSTARSQVANLIEADSKSIVFTSGATESNNIALLGVMRALGAKNGKTGLIVTSVEHKAILDPAEALERGGFAVSVAPVDKYGQVHPESIKEAIGDDTKIVSVIFANNEVGTINAIKEIGTICRGRGVLFHTDATQAVGKVPISVRTLPIDLLSLSAHKMYGPKGVGALYVRPGSPRIKIEPLMYGGGHERRMRSGTIAVPLIVGLGKACELAANNMDEDSKRIRQLRDDFVAALTSSLDGVTVNGHPTERLPGNAHLSFDGVNSEALLLRLRDVVCLSTGSACTTANPEPSHVLTAMGISKTQIGSSIRVGLGRFNTTTEVETVVVALSEAVRDLRRLAVT